MGAPAGSGRFFADTHFYPFLRFLAKIFAFCIFYSFLQLSSVAVFLLVVKLFVLFCEAS